LWCMHAQKWLRCRDYWSLDQIQPLEERDSGEGEQVRSENEGRGRVSRKARGIRLVPGIVFQGGKHLESCGKWPCTLCGDASGGDGELEGEDVGHR